MWKKTVFLVNKVIPLGIRLAKSIVKSKIMSTPMKKALRMWKSFSDFTARFLFYRNSQGYTQEFFHKLVSYSMFITAKKYWEKRTTYIQIIG